MYMSFFKNFIKCFVVKMTLDKFDILPLLCYQPYHSDPKPPCFITENENTFCVLGPMPAENKDQTSSSLFSTKL